MANKKNPFGKLLAFTSAIVAVGGTCYIFRDKIKASPLYSKSKDKLSDLINNASDKFASNDDDDFLFDDDFDDVFSTAERGREYTSITINAKDDANETEPEEANESETDDTSTDDSQEESIPIISFDRIKNDSKTDQYENDGLSDVSEDPDTLEEQDKLDF